MHPRGFGRRFIDLAALSFLVLGAVGSDAQTLNFVDSGQALGDQVSIDVALGDVDGDGDLDALVANDGSPLDARNRLWINQGNAQAGAAGVFAAAAQDFGERNSAAVALGDVDGDGDLDAVFAHVSEGDRVWINQGGVFTDSGQSLGSAISRDLALGDLDNDGDLDLVVVTPALGEPDRIWFNQGGGQGGAAGTFQAGPALASLASQAVVLLDAEGDGDLDVMVGVFGSGGSSANRLYLNQGGAQGGAIATFLDSGQLLGDRTTHALAVGDLDGDADPDVLAGNGAVLSTDRVWINQGGSQGGVAGVFQPGADVFGDTTLGLALGDLDGDGDLDAFLPRFQQPDVGNEIWLNDGSAGFADSGLRLGNSQSRSAALGDLDGDGDLDVFVANGVIFGNVANRVWFNESVTAPEPQADLELTAQIPPSFGFLATGDDLLRTGLSIQLTNRGPDPATNVRMVVRGVGSTVTGGFDCSPTGDVGPICTLPTLVPGSTEAAELGRSIPRPFDSGIYAGTVSVGVSISADETDPVPGGLDVSATRDWYDCDNACFVEALFCFARGFARNGSGRSALGWEIDLPVYYLLRQKMNFSAPGARLVGRYVDHQAEILSLAQADADRMARLEFVLSTWEPGLSALVVGQGDTVTIDSSMVDALEALLDELSLVGSPELATAIAEERAAIGPLAAFVGLDFREAADRMIPSEVMRYDGFERPETLVP